MIIDGSCLEFDSWLSRRSFYSVDNFLLVIKRGNLESVPFFPFVSNSAKVNF